MSCRPRRTPHTRCTSQDNGSDSGNGNGMTYSIATRVVEQYPGTSKLQVQVRYSDTVEDTLENMPNPADALEWFSMPSSQQIYQGGREIALDVSCASFVPTPATAA